MQVIVKDNIKEFTRQLDNIQKRQIPYATSRALNDVAVEAQESIIKQIMHVFKNRKKWWGRNQPTGVKVKFSKKNDLHSAVFTKAPFAKLQEEGGIKTPRRSKNLAIPTIRVPRKYFTSKGARQMIGEKNNVFVSGKGVFRRRGKKNIELMWSFTKQATVKPRFGFYAIAEKVVKRRFAKIFEKWLKIAIETAKTPKL